MKRLLVLMLKISTLYLTGCGPEMLAATSGVLSGDIGLSR